LRAGDCVRFRAITREEFEASIDEALSTRAKRGTSHSKSGCEGGSV
jgi:hypothetical protein